MTHRLSLLQTQKSPAGFLRQGLLFHKTIKDLLSHDFDRFLI